MNLGDVKKAPLPRRKRTRVGRGNSSGLGKTSGRGVRGQKARSGGTIRPLFEGGQKVLYQRLPKRGFNNAGFEQYWVAVNLKELNIFNDGHTVTPDELVKNNLIKVQAGQKFYVKILGKGDLTKKNLTIKAHKISEGAQKKLEETKGKFEGLKFSRTLEKKKRNRNKKAKTQ